MFCPTNILIYIWHLSDNYSWCKMCFRMHQNAPFWRRNTIFFSGEGHTTDPNPTGYLPPLVWKTSKKTLPGFHPWIPLGLCPVMYFRFCEWRYVFTWWQYSTVRHAYCQLAIEYDKHNRRDSIPILLKYKYRKHSVWAANRGEVCQLRWSLSCLERERWKCANVPYTVYWKIPETPTVTRRTDSYRSNIRP